VPIVNVDTVAEIEKWFLKTGEIVLMRKNQNLEKAGPKVCGDRLESYGVDLNRNYGVSWGEDTGSSGDPCAENYRGEAPFSEPETRAIRDFLISHKDEVKFVYNFHAYGNMYLWPYNGKSPNNLDKKNPDVLKVFTEIWNESDYPMGTLHGNAFEAL